MKLNDLKEASLGGAMLSSLGKKLNPFSKSGADRMSVQDTMKQQQFIQDFISRAATNLSQGIQGGLVDPDPNAGKTPAVAQQTPAQSIEQNRIAKQKAAGAAAQQQMTAKPAPAAQPTPAQIRQQKQVAATSTAQQQMAANPAPARPLTPAQIRQQKQAAASAAAQQQMSGAVKESVLSEQGQGYTISTYLQNFLKQYMKGMDTSALKPMADAVQATYSQDKGLAALKKLASAAYSLYWTAGRGTAEEPEISGAPTSVGDAIAKGLQQGMSQPAGSTAAAASQGQSAAKNVYIQAKELIKSLTSQQKGWILNRLEKDIGVTPTSTKPTSLPSDNNVMGSIASQLAASPTASSTGGTTTGVSGVGSNVVRHAAGKGTKIKQANALNQKQVVAAPRKKASALPVAEGKKYKVWGEE